MDGIKCGRAYRVVKAGSSYLGIGEVYVVTSDGRSLYCRNVATGSGTSIAAWQLQRGNVILAEVKS